jgi:hypothetical protein
MLYFIGGAARCGKTTLARAARSKIDAQVIATDGMTSALQKNISLDWIPELSSKAMIMDPKKSVQSKLEIARTRDELVWKFLLSFIEEAEFSDDSLLMEGGIWADILQDLPYAHRAVFLVDTSDDHRERVLAIRDNASHSNWMKDFDDEIITKWVDFNIARSKKHIELCDKLGYRYFDIKDYGVDKAQQLALEYLIGV